MFLIIGLTPYISKPSSVKVPVLSKQRIVIYPEILTRWGEIQYIDFDFILLRAKEIPIERQVGKAGGTAIVTKSKKFKIT